MVDLGFAEVEYQGRVCHAVSFSRSNGLNPDTGQVQILGVARINPPGGVDRFRFQGQPAKRLLAAQTAPEPFVNVPGAVGGFPAGKPLEIEGELKMEIRGGAAPIVRLQRIFVGEGGAKIVQEDQAQPGFGVLEVEITDIRSLWPSRGVVRQDRNVVDPDRGVETSAGRMDPRTLTDGGKRPFTAAELWQEVGEALPGKGVRRLPPRLLLVQPPNIMWGPGKQALQAAHDLAKLTNVVVSLSDENHIDLYELGEEADVRNALTPGSVSGNQVIDRKDIAVLTQRPIAVEVVGGRTIQELAVPDWEPVVSWDGSTGEFFKDELVPLSEAVESWGYSVEKALRGAALSLSRDSSKAWADLPRENPDDAAIFETRRNILKRDLLKKFRCKGACRKLLPALEFRPRVIPGNVAFEKEELLVWIDQFKAGENLAETLREGRFENLFLHPTWDGFSFDGETGVLTFSQAMGRLKRASPRFAITKAIEQFWANGQNRTNFDLIIAATKLKNIVGAAEQGKFGFGSGTESEWQAAEREAVRVVRDVAGYLVDDGRKVSVGRRLVAPSEDPEGGGTDEVNITFNREVQIFATQSDIGVRRNTHDEMQNMEELTFVLPQILALISFERRNNDPDDHYRFRLISEAAEGANELLIEEPDLIRVNAVTHNNVAALDRAALQIAKEAVNFTPLIHGQDFDFLGFWPIGTSGTVQQVAWEYGSGARAEVRTRATSDPFNGIGGRPGWARRSIPGVIPTRPGNYRGTGGPR